MKINSGVKKNIEILGKTVKILRVIFEIEEKRNSKSLGCSGEFFERERERKKPGKMARALAWKAAGARKLGRMLD